MSSFPQFRDTVRNMAAADPALRREMLVECGRALLEGDIVGTRDMLADYLASLSLAGAALPPLVTPEQGEALLDLSRDLPAETVLAALSACLAHEGIELAVKQRMPRGRRKRAAERLPAAAAAAAAE